MQQPFDLVIGNVSYAVFPEGNDTYVIFKNGKEFVSIQKDTDTQWLTLDPETALPVFEINDEINRIGQAILSHIPEEEEEEDEFE